MIEKSYGDWASNVVIVTKKDGSPRFCIDYRAVNNKTRKDAFPLPLISECLDTLGGSSWFSTFDLRSGYHQVALHPDDRHKTAFVTRGGYYQFKVLPFGLTGSPSCFSRLMTLIMSGLNFTTCLIYLDDIIIFSSDLDTHLERLILVLKRLTAANLKLKPSKCHLLQRKVLFLGHVVSGSGVATDPAKVDAVKNWPIPTKLKEVRAFMGLCSYYRKFVPDFARIGRPLHAMTKKDTRFVWTEECNEAFQSLKTHLTEAPILALPNDIGSFILDTDASGESIGGVLSQVQDGAERVICYGSRVCSPAEQNYDVTKRELLAIVHFLKTYRPYLLGRKFLLRTDHSALQWLRKTPLPIGQQARWLTVIEEFDFDLKHRPGSAHGNADAMSRRPQLLNAIQQETTPSANVLNMPRDWSRSVIIEEQRADEDLGWIIRKKLESTEAPTPEVTKRMSPMVKLLAAQWPQLELQDGLLVRQWLHEEDNSVRWRQLIPPPSRRGLLVQLAHEGMTGGHLGLKRTLVQVKRRAYWPGWRQDTKLQLQRCLPCARYLRGKPARQGPLQNMMIGGIGELLSLDLTGPHPVTPRGHRYILTIEDHYSRWAEAFPVRNQEAITVARVLADQWIARFGCPLQILTDQGPCFEAELFQDLCKLLSIHKIRTSPYKASSNGLLERFHRTLNSMIAKFISSNHKDWDLKLPTILAAYRASEHSSTGFTPNMLFLHRETCMPLDLVLDDCYVKKEAPAYHDFVYERGQRIQSVAALARECMKTQQEVRAFRYDTRVKSKEFQIGQLVLYFYPRRRQGLKDKWESYYVGPFKVESKVGPVLYQIRKTPRSQAKLVYVDKLKLFHGPLPACWGGMEPEEDVAPFLPEEIENDLPLTSRPKRQINPPVRYGFDN